MNRVIGSSGDRVKLCHRCMDGDTPIWRELTQQWVHAPNSGIGLIVCLDPPHPVATNPNTAQVMYKRYDLSLDELRWLVQIDEDRNDATECHNCEPEDSEACASCEAAIALSSKLRDMLSLAEAGVLIITTTQLKKPSGSGA